MDLLCDAYANTSDDEPELEPQSETAAEIRPSKRPRMRSGSDHPYNTVPRPLFYWSSYSDLQTSSSASIPGRYVSKRERSLLASLPSVTNPDRDPVVNVFASSPTVIGSISDSELPHDVLLSLRHSQPTQMPNRVSISLSGHTKAVSAIDWSPSCAHLLASAGLDNAVYVWNVWSRDKKKARAFNFHNAPVKDVKWSNQGPSILSCGYDCSSRLVDVEKGVETQTFKEDQVVGVVKFHPDNSNMFLSGGSKGRLRLWDIRSNKVIHEYIRSLGPILDVEFVNGGERFISSSDVSCGNVSENAVIIWDVSREVPLSNQVYAEAYTCPCIKRHPHDQIFIAQSNGNYIAIFSSNPPFKLNKYKRYEGHWVSGFPVKCSFSVDGETLVSGSSDGSMYFYNYRSSELIKKIKPYEQPCVDVAHHPLLPNVIASCSWTGDVSVAE